jgi:hypothetical protein
MIALHNATRGLKDTGQFRFLDSCLTTRELKQI